MNGLDDARDKISRLMAEQAAAEAGTLPSNAPQPAYDARRLPLRVAYVDRAAERLVVGIAADAAAHRSQHLDQLRSIVGDIGLEVRYLTVESDACPGVRGDCRPIRGGVRVNGAGTLSIVILQDVNGAATPFTIVSGHVVGPPGRPVGQPSTALRYGNVTVNPPLTNRTSDAALTDVNTRRVDSIPYAIWAGPNEEYYTVTGLGANLAVGDEVCMQGANSGDLQEGAVTQLDVTIRDARGVLTRQVHASYGAAGGDSGAPVFGINETNNTAVYYGIHAGRVVEIDGTERSYFSTWNNIANELGVHPIDVPRD